MAAPAIGGATSSTHAVCRCNNDVSASGGEVVGHPFASVEKVVEAALDQDHNEQAPTEHRT